MTHAGLMLMGQAYLELITFLTVWAIVIVALWTHKRKRK